MVVFHALNKEHIRSIVDLMLKTVHSQLLEKGIKMSVNETAKDLLGEKGFDEVFGARPLKRAIQDLVIDKLSEAILRSEFRPGDTAVVDVKDGQIVLRQLDVLTEAEKVLALTGGSSAVTNDLDK
jgi:ATP-dependent Clp protease ATP-binding subunit ClpC